MSPPILLPAPSSRGFLYCVTPTSLSHISTAPQSCRGMSQGKWQSQKSYNPHPHRPEGLTVHTQNPTRNQRPRRRESQVSSQWLVKTCAHGDTSGDTQLLTLVPVLLSCLHAAWKIRQTRRKDKPAGTCLEGLTAGTALSLGPSHLVSVCFVLNQHTLLFRAVLGL